MRNIKRKKQFRKRVKVLIGKFLNFHKESLKKNIFIFGTRRSGTTWLTNIVFSQAGVKYADQPPDWDLHKHRLSGLKASRFQIVSLEPKEESLLRKYYSDLLEDRIQVSPPWNIFSSDYNFITDRYVAKILNSNSIIEWFENNFDAHIVFLVRHPIPTVLSVIKRGWGDTVDVFLNNELYKNKYLTPEMIEYANLIKEGGDKFKILILEWCLENLVPINLIKSKKKTWKVITYEELALNPEGIINILANDLNLTDITSMLNKVRQPSKTCLKDSARFIRKNNRIDLIRRWKEKISANEEREVFDILNKFGIDAYRYRSLFPARYLINFPDYFIDYEE